MKEFIISNWVTIVVLVALVAYVVYLAVTKQWEKLKEFAYALMLQAERIYADNQGSEKFNAVFDELYAELMPAWLRLFVSPGMMKKKLQEWYDAAKEYLKSDSTVTA